MPSQIKLVAGMAALTLLTGCGAAQNMFGSDDPSPRAQASAQSSAQPLTSAVVPDTPVLIGNPYSLGGQRYTPIDQVDYDEVGYASWYGNELAGRPTANGEVFAPEGITAAHRTLPVPSYVEVTRLDTGRTILVRINDRGPADGRRLIDLSAGAAQQLGVSDAGTFAVRVRRVNPVEAERLALRSGRAVPERLDTPDSLLSILRERAARLPTPSGRAVATPAPRRDQRPPVAPAPAIAQRDVDAPAAEATGASGFVVQLGAFSSRPRADALARRLNARVVTAGSIHRVRYGPFATEAEADEALAEARRRGHTSGVVVRNR